MREMKDSGIAWVNEIPSDWRIIPNKYLMSKEKNICPIYDGQDILSLTMNGVIVRDLEAGGKMPSSFDGYQYLYAGNLLMCLFDIDVTPRCVGLIRQDGLSSPAYSQFVLNSDADAAYYCYYYTMLDNDKILLHLAKNLRHSLTEEQLGAISMVAPPISEQHCIATFLNSKCAEIDSLSADIQAQIDTLEAYKRSVITEAVTKGLNPDVEMKESGVSWIGNIPKTYTTSRIKYELSPLNRAVREDDDVITCFRDGEVTLRKNRREDGFTISFTEHGYQGVAIGDLVIHGMDAFAGAIGCSDSRGKTTPVVHVCKTSGENRYFMYFLRSMAYNNVFMDFSSGIRVRSSDFRNFSKLGELPIIVPPIEDQRIIIQYIDVKCAKIDAIITAKKEQLTTLADYKKSLIYEYVTGKKEV